MSLNNLLGLIYIKHLWFVVLGTVIYILCFKQHGYKLIPISSIFLVDSTSNETTSVHAPMIFTGLDSSGDDLRSTLSLHTFSDGFWNYSKVATYVVPKLYSLEDFLINKKRRASQLHNFNLRFVRDLPNVLYLRSISDNGYKKFVSVSPNYVNSTVCSPSNLTVVVYDSQLMPIWSAYVPFSWTGTQWGTCFKVDLFSLSIATQSTCPPINRRHCNFLYLGFTTYDHKDVHQYSTVAMALDDGSLLWRFPSGYSEGPTTRTLNHPPSVSKFWKIKLMEQYHMDSDMGEFSWTDYLETLSAVFPLTWYSSKSSELRFVCANKNEQRQCKPNALVAIHPGGLNIITISTGRLLARLSYKWKVGSTYAIVPTPKSASLLNWSLKQAELYEITIGSQIVSSYTIPYGFKFEEVSDDLNTDIDDQSDFSHTIDCYGTFKRVGDLSHGHLDRLKDNQPFVYHSLCSPHRFLDYPRFGRSEWLDDPQKSVPPVVIKRDVPLPGLQGFLLSLLGDNHFHHHMSNHPLVQHTTHHPHYDIYFLTSDGSLTSISNHGFQNWRTNAQVSWLQVARTLAASKSSTSINSVDDILNDIYINNFQPSLWPFDLALIGRGFVWDGFKLVSISKGRHTIPVLVAIGWDSVSVVDRLSGSLLGSHKLPSQPIGKPILLPLLTNDAKNRSDAALTNCLIIVPCNGVILAFGLYCDTGNISTIFVALCLFWLCIIRDFWLSHGDDS